MTTSIVDRADANRIRTAAETARRYAETADYCAERRERHAAAQARVKRARAAVDLVSESRTAFIAGDRDAELTMQEAFDLLDAEPSEELPAEQPAEFTRESVAAIALNGFFGVTFTKKDGSTRRMVCRLGVTKHLRGGVKSFSDADHNILTVWSVADRGYRSIRLDTLAEVRAGGVTHTAGESFALAA